MSDPGSELTITLKLDATEATRTREQFVRDSRTMDLARVVKLAPQTLPPDLRRALDLADPSRTLMPSRLPVGPAQRLQRARQQLATAQQQGTPAQAFDAQNAVRVAQAAMDRAQKAANPQQDTFFTRLESLFMRSRYGAGGVAPLGMDIARLLGRGAPVALAVGAFATIIKDAADAVKQLAERARSFEQARFTSGATPAEQARLDVIGGSLGMSGMDTAQAAREFARRRQTDPNAMRFFGFRPPDIAGAPTDVAGDFMKALMKIRQAPSEEAALRMARAGGLEEFMGVRNMSPQALQMMAAAAQMHEKNMQGTAQFGSDFGVTTGILDILGKDAATLGAKGAMTSDNPIISGLRKAASAGAFGPLGGIIAGVSGGMKDLQKPAGPGPNVLGGMMGPSGAMGPGGVSFDPVVDALNRNTAANERNNQLLQQQGVYLQDMNRHFHGAGQRARNASPAHLRYQSLSAFLDDSGLQLGQLD